MRIAIIAVGTRMPAWVVSGVEEYLPRFPAYIQPELIEVTPGNRKHKGESSKAMAREGEELLRHAGGAEFLITLDEHGRQWTTRQLAQKLQNWQQQYNRIALLIGGPDGLSDACKKAAHHAWSLSRLTLPHALVRVMLIEQLYRATTILQGHPYHRP